MAVGIGLVVAGVVQPNGVPILAMRTHVPNTCCCFLHSGRVLRVLGKVVTDVRAPITSHNLGVWKAGRVERLAQGLDVRAVRVTLVLRPR